MKAGPQSRAQQLDNQRRKLLSTETMGNGTCACNVRRSHFHYEWIAESLGCVWRLCHSFSPLLARSRLVSYPFPRSFLDRFFCGCSSRAVRLAPSANHAQKFIAAFMTFPLFIVLAVATRPETSMISAANERSSASSRN